MTLPGESNHRPLIRMLRRWPITTFYVLTLIVSWPLGLLPPGPSIAAIAAAALIDGRSGVTALLRRVLIWRVGVRWYVVALVGPVALVLAAVFVNMSIGAEMVNGKSLFDLPALGSLFLLQVVGVFAGPWEELGWRGFALPRLLEKWSPLVASLILGLLWAVWHIPLLISGDLPWADAAVIFLISILVTAVFVRTKQSVLITFLMHASLNGAAGVAVPLFQGSDRTQLYWSLALMTAVTALLVVAMDARWWLTGPSRHSVHSHDPEPESEGLAI